jgi:hypothetical protein
MFVRVVSYPTPILSDAGEEYTAHAYASLNEDETWSGYLLFFPLLTRFPPISTPHEVTVSTVDAVSGWAKILSPSYLQDALARAIGLDRPEDVSAQLAASGSAEAIAATEAVDRSAAAPPHVTKADLTDTLVRAEGAIADAEREIRESARIGAATRQARGVAADEVGRSRKSGPKTSAKVPGKKTRRAKNHK